MEPVKHGGHIWEFAQERNLSITEVHDFSANINPLGPVGAVKDLLEDPQKLQQFVIHYPREDYQPLLSALSSKFSVDPHEIVVGNGATELLSRLLETQKSVMIPKPSYGEYLAVCQRHLIPTFSLDWEQARQNSAFLVNQIEKIQPTAVILPCPNNPTSDMMSLQAMKDLFLRFPQITWIVDASFVMFLEKAREILDFLLHSRAITVMSLTKYYALPGLRLGWARLAKEQAQALNFRLDPWRVNALAAEAGRLSLQDQNFDYQTQQWLQAERDYVCRLFLPKNVLPLANFFQLEFADQDKKNRAIQAWADQAILVRDCESFGQPLQVRLAIKKRQENQKLLKTYLKTKHQAFKVAQ